LHAARERELVVGLDDEVEAGAGEPDVDDPEVVAAEGARDRALDRAERGGAREVADARDHARGDVHRVDRRDRRPRLVRLARPRAAGRSARARACPAPRPSLLRHPRSGVAQDRTSIELPNLISPRSLLKKLLIGLLAQ